MKKDKEFYANRTKKAKENKEKLVEEIIDMILDNSHNYRDVIESCIRESFSKCPQSELKTWL
jgi:hypothetical protein